MRLLRRPQHQAGVAAIFEDNFDDNSLDGAKWTRIGSVTGFSVAESSQHLSETAGSTSGADGIVTVNSFDMTDRNWTWEGVQLAASSGLVSYNILIDGSSRYFGFVKSAGGASLVFEHNNGSNSDTSILYDSTAHRWLRLKFTSVANTMEWQTSPDNVTWTSQRTVSSWTSLGFTNTALKFRLQLNMTTPSGGTVIYDNVSLRAN